MKTIMVPIGALQAHPMNPRSAEALAANTAALESSLRRGQHKPLTVRPLNGENFEILAGHRTAYVAQSLGFAELACTVVDLDDTEALKVVIGDNASVESVTTLGTIASIESLLNVGVSKKEVFEIVGLSKARVNDLLKLGSMDPSLLEALETSELAKDGKLTASTLMAVSRVDGFGTVDPGKVLELVSGKARSAATDAVKRWIASEAARLARVAAHEAGESVLDVEPQKRAPRTPSAPKAEKTEKTEKTDKVDKVDNTALAKACLALVADLDQNGFKLAPEADVIVARTLSSNDVDVAGALYEALETLFELGIILRAK